MGRPITHFEIASPNLESATEFYRQLFDWSVGEELIDGYRLVQTAEGSIGGRPAADASGRLPCVTIFDFRVPVHRDHAGVVSRREASCHTAVTRSAFSG